MQEGVEHCSTVVPRSHPWEHTRLLFLAEAVSELSPRILLPRHELGSSISGVKHRSAFKQVLHILHMCSMASGQSDALVHGRHACSKHKGVEHIATSYWAVMQ